MFVTEPMLRQQTTFNTRLFLSAKKLKTAEELLPELIDEMQARPHGWTGISGNRAGQRTHILPRPVIMVNAD